MCRYNDEGNGKKIDNYLLAIVNVYPFRTFVPIIFLTKIRKSMQAKNISYTVFVLLLVLMGTQLFAQQNKTDHLGRKQGEWVKYKDGVKFYEGRFVDDKPIGEFRRYYKSGRLKSKSLFSDQGKRSHSEFYYDSRKNVLKAEGIYIDKKKDSIWLYYSQDGVLVNQETYKLGVANGWWKLYNYLGALVKETPYKNGYVDGLQKEYFDNSVLKRSIYFTLDTINGAMKVYYPEGQIRVEGEYSHGLQQGKWIHYQLDGKVWFVENYKDGELLNRQDEFGKPFELEVEQDTARIELKPEDVIYK